MHELVFKVEVPTHAEHDLVDFHVVGLALSAAAQRINLVLNGGAKKFALDYFELSVEQKFLFHFPAKRRNVDLCLQKDLTFHEGIALHRQSENISQISLRHADIEADRP